MLVKFPLPLLAQCWGTAVHRWRPCRTDPLLQDGEHGGESALLAQHRHQRGVDAGRADAAAAAAQPGHQGQHGSQVQLLAAATWWQLRHGVWLPCLLQPLVDAEVRASGQHLQYFTHSPDSPHLRFVEFYSPQHDRVLHLFAIAGLPQDYCFDC